jgi:hypothetical protein
MVAATDLLELGLTLMDTCEDGPGKTYQATRYRDGPPDRALDCIWRDARQR